MILLKAKAKILPAHVKNLGRRNKTCLWLRILASMFYRRTRIGGNIERAQPDINATA